MKPPTKRQIQESEEERIKMLLKATEKKETNPIDEIDVDKEFVNENYLKNDPNTIEAHGIDSALDAMTLEDYDKHNLDELILEISDDGKKLAHYF